MSYQPFPKMTDYSADWGNDALEYLLDGVQRSVLFADTLRKRGNNFIEHWRSGQPPVLTFDYRVVLDGRELDPPVNFALVHIVGHRAPGRHERRPGAEKRRDPPPDKEYLPEDPAKRPIVIIDPRAGHGPGIGGSKRDSQVGNALSEGHPVYFVIFYTEPQPGQTLPDVHNAVGLFIEEVIKRHPDAEQPMIIGNCQAGWATALIGADRPEITGPLVLNGAPMSFWASIEGKNPMTYRAGLLGGVWVASFLSDLGCGTFDGANLVAGFEDLNPANTIWTKQYNLFANIDTEDDRYLKFEKWWSGFFLLSDEEIHFILDSLFVGNELEMGTLEFTPGKRIDLCNIEEPVLVFSSKGDNITPPHQALNWIREVYGSVEEIIRQQKVLVYMVHERVGHLGIFVSKSVAVKEHREIIENVELIRYLPPGLYEMVIEESEEVLGMPDYRVRFEERTIEDLLLHEDDQRSSTPAFRNVAALSRINDQLYRALVRPWIRMWLREPAGEALRYLHPLRLQRFLISDLNPFMWPVKLAAPAVREHRIRRSEGNPFVQWEREMSRAIEEGLDLFREIRDRTQELVFRSLYENPLLEAALRGMGTGADTAQGQCIPMTGDAARSEEPYWTTRMERGGFIEGAVRSLLSVMSADDLISTLELEHLRNLVNRHDRFRKIDSEELRRIISEQSQLLHMDENAALNALTALLPRKKDRQEVVSLARELAHADEEYGAEEADILRKLKRILQV